MMDQEARSGDSDDTGRDREDTKRPPDVSDRLEGPVISAPQTLGGGSLGR